MATAATLALAACAAGPKVVDNTDPWQSDREEFLRYAKVIGLADVYMPDGMQDPEPIKQNFSELIAAELRGAGFTVVRPQEYTTNWDRAVVELGGLEDTTSTGRDPRKIALAMTHVLSELEAGFNLDGVLIPAIVVVEAPFAGGRAAWDGRVQSIKTGGAVKSFFAGSPEGTLGALSLSVTLVSPHGTTLYENAGGIEVLSKLEGKEFVLVPRSELFTSQKLIEKSVGLALGPLVD
jgi:hypothetical protein